MPRKPRATTFEIPGVRVSLTYTPGVRVEDRPVARSHADVAPLFARFIGDALDREHFVAALVDAESCVVGLTLIAIGTGTSCEVRAADVFRPVVMSGSARCYLAHSHPSGHTTPSPTTLPARRCCSRWAWRWASRCATTW